MLQLAIDKRRVFLVQPDTLMRSFSRDQPLRHDVLNRLLAVARHLSASAALTDILQAIIDAMRDVLEADRATVFEFDPLRNELFITVAHGLDAAAGARSSRTIRIPATVGLAGESVQTRRIINVPDAYLDPRFNPAIDRESGYRTRSMLTIPLVGHDGELVGVAQVLNKRSGVFTQEDEEIALALAAHAAVAIKRGRLIEDRLMRLKLERDLELARQIQQSSFPASLPVVPGFEIAAWNQPADQTGGDVYDVIVRDAASPHHRLVLLMADAAGHGVGPALSVTQLCSMLRMAVRLGVELPRVVQQTNLQLCADLPPGRFITAWMGELDPHAAVLHSFSAGQAPLLHYQAASRTVTSFSADTVPLGLVDFSDSNIQPHRIILEQGDIFAVVSDGVFEASNNAQERFGTKRIAECLHAHHHADAGEIMRQLREAVNHFTQHQPAQDDQTVLIIKRSSKDISAERSV